MLPFRIGLHPRAAADIDTIAIWWREHRRSAPELFLEELDRAFALIADNPNVGHRVSLRAYPNVRTYVLRRTKYVVIYNVDFEASEIAVARVRHGKRRPLATLKRG